MTEKDWLRCAVRSKLPRKSRPQSGPLVTYCAAAESLNIDVQFRIPHTCHADLVGRVLDFGPIGLSFSLDRHLEYPLRTIVDRMRNVAGQLAGTNIRFAKRTPILLEQRDKFCEMRITLFQEGLPV